MKKIIFILIMLILGACVYGANTQSLGVVYSLGIFSSKMCDGIVVGDGEYVLTKKSVVFETLNKYNNGKWMEVSGSVNKYPLFVSNETGDIYECKTVAVLEDVDLALLKLPKKLKYTNKIEPLDNKFPTGKYEIVPEGKKLLTTYVCLNRDEEGVFTTRIFNSKKGLLEKNVIAKNIYICDKELPTLTTGGMLLKDDKFIGVLNSYVPFTDFGKNKSFLACRVFPAYYVLDYCKDKNIPFTNGETVEGNANDKLVYLTQGNKIFSALDYGNGESQLKACEEFKNNSAFVFALMGMIYEKDNKLTEAENNYNKALELDPNLTYAKIRVTNLRKDKISALQNLAKEIEDYRIYDRISDAYLEQTNYSGALTFINKAVEQNKTDPILLLKKAKIQRKLGDYKGVVGTISELNKTIKWGDAFDFEVDFYIEVKDLTSAGKILKIWLKAEPTNVRANCYAAKTAYLLGDAEACKNYLNIAKTNTDPNDKETVDMVTGALGFCK